MSTVVELLQKISDSARGEFEEGSEKQMREALQSIHVAAEQAIKTVNSKEDDLLRIARYFVEWVDGVWGSAALSGETLAEYEFAKKTIAAAGDTRRQG
jgi:hypothetical protein